MSDAFKKYQDDWREAFIAAGHSFVKDGDGNPDFFVISQEFHNGPECETCGWSCCQHCTPKSDIPVCDGGKYE